MYVKTILPKSFFLLIAAFGFLSYSCTLKEDDMDPQPLPDGIVGVWNLQKSEVEAYVMGTKMEDTDDNPSGTIVFVAGGLGAGEFSTTLFGFTYGTFGDYTWVRNGNEITVTEMDGTKREWTIVSLESNSMKLSWSDSINSANADFVFTLTK